jgi:hypothetical protein
MNRVLLGAAVAKALPAVHCGQEFACSARYAHTHQYRTDSCDTVTEGFSAAGLCCSALVHCHLLRRCTLR